MTLANSHPVSRASLLAALALLGSLGIAPASLGSTGGHRTTYNHSPASDWPIESSTAASNAFAAGIQAPTYAGNDYSSTETSPIPPPKPVP